MVPFIESAIRELKTNEVRYHSCGINQMGAVCFLRKLDMYKRVLGLAISALIGAYGAGAIAQDRMTPQPDMQQAQSHPMGCEGAGMIGQGGMMGGGMMGRSMMGGGDIGPPASRRRAIPAS